MKTILFPTDFSLNSEHAIRYGLNMFKGQDVSFILLNTYVDPSIGANMTYVFEDQMKSISQTMLNKVHESLIEEFGDQVKGMTLLSQYGDLPYALRPIMKERDVDLIIMGASGSSGPNISIFGSNAFATMKNATCPVLTIPLQAPISIPERIGLASETQLIGDEDILDPLLELARMHSSSIMGIQVKKKTADALVNDDESEIGNERLPYINLDIEDPLQGIELAISEHRIELLSIIIPERSLLDRIFHRSVSKQIAREIAIPILSLHS